MTSDFGDNEGMNSLDGIRVLDLSRVLAGPWCTQTLADLGADVIKIERPGTGDDTRTWGPPFLKDSQGRDTAEAAYYLGANRNKRSVTIDMAHPEGQALVLRLADTCDVLVENFKVGDMARYGLDADSLRRRCPRLVYCSITGFGQTGPRAHEAGYDFVVQGMSGFMSLTGEPEGHPVKMGISISDLSTGVWAANGIQAALLMRARTGRGQQVDISLMDSSVALLSNQATYFLTTGQNPPRMGNAHAQVAPYGVFAVSDGHVILAPANDGLFHKLMDLLGLSHLSVDPRFLANGDRTANAKALDAEIAAATAGWTKQGLLDACHAAGVPAGPINRLDEVFADPQVIARGLRVDLGGMPGVRSPFVFSDAELALDRPSPIHGQDG